MLSMGIAGAGCHSREGGATERRRVGRACACARAAHVPRQPLGRQHGAGPEPRRGRGPGRGLCGLTGEGRLRDPAGRGAVGGATRSLAAGSSSIWASVAPQSLPDPGLRVCPAHLEDSGGPPLARARPPLRSPVSPSLGVSPHCPPRATCAGRGPAPLSRVCAFVVAAGAVKPGDAAGTGPLASREGHSSPVQPRAPRPESGQAPSRGPAGGWVGFLELVPWRLHAPHA